MMGKKILFGALAVVLAFLVIAALDPRLANDIVNWLADRLRWVIGLAD